MDLLRRIFGLQPAPDTPVPATAAPRMDIDGPTAPLDRHKPKSQPQPLVNPKTGGASTPVTTPAPVATAVKDDPGATNILEEVHTQRLPDLEAALNGRKGRHIAYGQHSDVGQIRNNNQDAIFSFMYSSVSSEEQPEMGVFIVADGMGGHHDGERASAIAARTVARYTSSEILLPLLRREEASADRPTITEILRQAIQQANSEVSKDVPDGGTTVTAAAIVGDLAYIGHVGDSRAYLISPDGIEQLTRDHSLVQRLIELDQLTPEEAAEHPQRNVLYRAIGQNESIDVDAITRRLTPGSRLLLCSDGLWNLVPEEEIRMTVASSPTPQMACESLVKLANARGGPDNISVVIVKMPD